MQPYVNQSSGNSAPSSASSSDEAVQGAMFEKLASHAIDQLYGQGLSAVQQRLSQGGDLADTMGTIAAGLIAGSFQAALKSKVNIPPDVVVAAIMQVCKAIAEIAYEMQLLNTSNAKEVTEDSVFEAVKILATQIQLSPEQTQGFKQALQFIQSGSRGAKRGQTQPQQQPQGGIV